MSSWQITKIWWDYHQQLLKFRVIDDHCNKEICVIYPFDINNFFGTDDTPENAEQNFENNEDHLVSIASMLIDNDMADDDDIHRISYNQLI